MVASVEVKPRTVNGALAPTGRRRGRVMIVTSPPSGERSAIQSSSPQEAICSEPGGFPPAAHAVDEEISHDLIATVAYELWAMHGGNEVLNWLEAERMLRRLIAARCDARGRAARPDARLDLLTVEPAAVARAFAAQHQSLLNETRPVLNGHIEEVDLKNAECT